jgi:capsular polysaccharide biosynthesis protein
VLSKKNGVGVYGHWLLEMLPRAMLAKASLQEAPGRYIVESPSDGITRVIRESTRMAGIGPLLWTDRSPTFHENLVLVNGVCEDGAYISPLAFAAVATLAQPVKAAREGRLFVTRRNNRTFTDLFRIEDAIRRLGFKVVDPSGMSFREQVCCFKGARVVAGVLGSAMTNLVFTPPGALVINFAPARIPDVFFWLICQLGGHRYHEVRCEQQRPTGDEEHPWYVNMTTSCDDVIAALTRIERSG